MGSIRRTILCQPFHRRCRQRPPEATDRPKYGILHCVTVVTPYLTGIGEAVKIVLYYIAKGYNVPSLRKIQTLLLPILDAT